MISIHYQFSILRIVMCAHHFYPKNSLTKHSSILRIDRVLIYHMLALSGVIICDWYTYFTYPRIHNEIILYYKINATKHVAMTRIHTYRGALYVISAINSLIGSNSQESKTGKKTLWVSWPNFTRFLQLKSANSNNSNNILLKRYKICRS